MKKLLAKVGSYQKDGQTKNKYVELGVVMSNDNGDFILMNPVSLSGILIQQNIEAAKQNKPASDRIMVGMFDNSNQGTQQQGGGGYQPQQPQPQAAYGQQAGHQQPQPQAPAYGQHQASNDWPDVPV